MIRDEFEAVVWRVAGRRLDALDVAAIVRAADAYAAAEGGLTAERRAVLAERIVHFKIPCPQAHDQCTTPATACNRTCWLPRRVVVSTNPAKVTCTKCKRTLAAAGTAAVRPPQTSQDAPMRGSA